MEAVTGRWRLVHDVVELLAPDGNDRLRAYFWQGLLPRSSCRKTGARVADPPHDGS